jgi:hypothetical protein
VGVGAAARAAVAAEHGDSTADCWSWCRSTRFRSPSRASRTGPRSAASAPAPPREQATPHFGAIVLRTRPQTSVVAPKCGVSGAVGRVRGRNTA